MKKLLSIVVLLTVLAGSVFSAENHDRKFEKGVAICQQIAEDYNIEVEIKKVGALPNNAAAVCIKKDEKFIIKLDWNYICGMTDNMVIPTLIHEMAHAITNNCGHDQRWISAIYDIVDYFPDLNRYEAYIISREVEESK